MTLSVSLLWLIPALPLLAAGVTALLPASARRTGAGLAVGALGLSLLLSVGALLTTLRAPAVHAVSNFAWFDLGADSLRLGWLLDPLTAFMCVMVTFVGTLIFIFSIGYMAEDPRAKQFFCFLSLFAAAMLGLLVSNSLLLLFVCWEIVGLASYLLIGFWFTKPAAATGSLLLFDGGAGVLETASLTALSSTVVCGGLAASTAIGLLIFCGAAGKSGQFPLHVWLPDAMEGPTPVSALIHAATMVAAGVFLIARIFPLMAADLALTTVPLHALTVVAFIGAITALLGACIAVAQNDLKRVLAFSTVSQLGYMMLAIGVGSWVAAIFHLLTHAFFKALLFLGAGSVIHGMHHEQDMRFMGGLSSKMKVTFRTFAIGMMALSGVPFLFSGFWSKEAILHAAHGWDVSHLPLAFGLTAVVLTAFYMTRLMAETFGGHGRSSAAEHAQESPASMTWPLVILATCAVLLGFLGTPAWPWLQSTLLGESEVHGHSLFDGAGLMVLSILLVALGIGLGWTVYGRNLRHYATDRDPLQARSPAVFAALANRLATVFRLNGAVASIADFADRWVWGGVVRALGGLGRWIGMTNLDTDEDVINGGFDGTSETLRESGQSYSRRQTGDAHGYLLTLVISFVVLAALLLTGGGS